MERDDRPPSPVTVVEILKRARTLVEEGWTQAAAARDLQGSPIPTAHRRAVQFCVTGAVKRACVEQLGADSLGQKFPYRGALNCLVERLFPDCRVETLHATAHSRLVKWNDQGGRRQSEAVALFEEAITCLK